MRLTTKRLATILIDWDYRFSLDQRGYILNCGRPFSRIDRAVLRGRLRDAGHKGLRQLADVIIELATTQYLADMGEPAPRRIRWA